jgi:membrane fusion protein (multidrug efflux system)
VEPGDRLFVIDPVPFEIALAEADAQLDVTRTDVAQLHYDIAEARAELGEARERQRFLKQQFDRQKKLRQRRMGSEEAYDQALHELKAGEESMRTIDQRIARSLAAYGNDPNMPVEDHPRYRHAMAVREKTLVDLGRTVVRAPAKGVVSNMKLQVGEYVEAGDPVFSLIETAPIWIEANLKETELTNIIPGQPATVVVDAYPDYEWWAFVDTIAPATGAEFALLPPQNATGNWVKVVQRIPVSLRIEPSGDDPILRAGMTAKVSIDTGHTRGLADVVPDAIANLSLPDFLRRALALDRTEQSP